VNEEIVVPGGESPKKLENFLKKRFPIGYVRKLFRKNGVRLNGQRPKPDAIVRPGDRLQLYVPFEKPLKAPTRGTSAPQTIFEDAKLIVLDKPAGLAVHEGKNILKRDTLLGILEARYERAGVVPRLVHRIDQDTSGLLVVAKDQQTAKELESRFEEGRVDKEYLALVVGRLPQSEGRIDFPLPGREGKAVRALTRFRIAKRFSDTTLVRVTIETGRMHQIRLHFARLGYPVVLDDQYGDFTFNRAFRKAYALKRQFLHAAKISLEYAGKKRIWTVPLADDLKRAMAALERGSARRNLF
jgi:23S rRNA pseudouridine955/2504/2580 synthase